MKQFLEIGKIVNTHGLKGELKVLPWCDSADFILDFDTLYLEDNTPLKVIKSRVHKNAVLIIFDGINDINIAEKYKNKVLFINRDDADLDGKVFTQDIIGFTVFDEYLNRNIGTLKEVLNFPASDIFVIEEGKKQHLVPDVAEFIKEIDLDKKLILVKTIDGMIEYEN